MNNIFKKMIYDNIFICEFYRSGIGISITDSITDSSECTVRK